MFYLVWSCMYIYTNRSLCFPFSNAENTKALQSKRKEVEPPFALFAWFYDLVLFEVKNQTCGIWFKHILHSTKPSREHLRAALGAVPMKPAAPQPSVEMSDLTLWGNANSNWGNNQLLQKPGPENIESQNIAMVSIETCPEQPLNHWRQPLNHCTAGNLPNRNRMPVRR